MTMFLNIVLCYIKRQCQWAYIRGTYIWGAYIYSGGLIFGGGAYIWNEVSVSVVGLYSGGLIFGGAYSRRFTVN